MKTFTFFFLLILTSATAQTDETKTITATLDNWHKAAADVKFNDYFNVLTEDAVYIGTDATENWNKKQFKAFAKPYFDKGRAWNFTALERHIYFSSDKKIVWFDELLDTQMKICRGSGIMVKEKNVWKIKHYVLSMTIPNEISDAVTKQKSVLEDAVIDTLKSK